jgi:uncharacterized membrane protein YphA (DoxX/SURF4 family)
MNEIIKVISKIIVAIVFIFSGFVKCVDPTGTAIKLEEYLVVFGMDFLIPLSLTLSVIMCGIELLVGIMLLINLKIKWAIWMAIALMVFYTPLTLWLALTNKVTDCGCFGDALVLTNWQTFFKNVVLDLFIIVLYIFRNRYKDIFKPNHQITISLGITLVVFGFEFYNLTHLPVIDFMPYKVGANIPQSMIVPEGAPTNVYKMTLFYEKDGKVKKFNQDNYPQNDTTWKFVDSKSKLVKQGYVAPIHDFNILATDGQDITDVVLYDEGYSLFLIYHSLKKANLQNIDEINRVVDQAITKGYKVYGLTSSLPEEFEAFREKSKATYPIYMMDGITLKTMVRSNPGLLLMKNGTVLGKWHHKQVKKIDNI